MTYVASALARVNSAWYGDDVVLDDVEDLDGVVELLREVIGDDAETGLLFVEENDEWFAILRIDADGDPRVFMSDARVATSSEIAAPFAEAAIEVTSVEAAEDDAEGEPEVDEDDTDDGARIDGDPAGDFGLMTDLGTSSTRLLTLCAEEGQLPSDVISVVCEAAGCLDVLEKLRGE